MPKTPTNKLCRDCTNILPKAQAKAQKVSFYCEDHAAARGITAAIAKRTKLARPAEIIDPMADNDAYAPREGTSAWFFWQYGQAYARGITRATGRPSTPPVVPGPKSILVQTMRVHARDETGNLIKGPAALRWLEDVVCDFRTYADERDYGHGVSQWSPAAFARWLDNGRPKAFAAQGTASAERRAHIAVKKG